MIDVMIITYNESANLPRCLRALSGWTNKVFVVDSGSTDGTPGIARDAGAEVVHHDWPGYARQKNWGLDTLPFEAPWVLLLDADEVITRELRDRLVAITSPEPGLVRENAFFINRVTMFLGRPLCHCGFFPSWNIRLLKRGRGRYEDREVHEHVVVDDPVGYVREPMIHDDRRGLEHYVAKHNRYSTLEAQALWNEMGAAEGARRRANLSPATRRRRWLKRYVLPHVPVPWLWRFLYMYVLRLGMLDGRAGLEFCKFISVYDYMVSLKLKSLRRRGAEGAGRLPAEIEKAALAVAEGAAAMAARHDATAEPAPRPAPQAPAVQPDRPAARPGDSPAPPVSVVIPARNEEHNITACLESCSWCDDVHVIDSGSADGTVEVARARGASVVEHAFESAPAQRAWALANAALDHDWVFFLDADERMTPALVEALARLLARDPAESAFRVPARLMFMGRWLRRSGGYPVYETRLVRRHHEAVLVECSPDGPVGTLDEPYLHHAFSRGLTDWFARANRRSTREALRLFGSSRAPLRALAGGNRAARRDAWRELSYLMPFRPTLRWLFTLFIRGGILEGRPGRMYARMLAIHEQMITLKLRLLRARPRPAASAPDPAAASAAADLAPTSPDG